MMGVDIPTISCEGPCVLKVSIVCDGVHIAGEHFVEIPLPFKREDYHRIEARVQLEAAVGTLVTARARDAVKVRAEATAHIIDALSAQGRPDAAQAVAKLVD